MNETTTTNIERDANSGYHDCPCRDCFEVAIGTEDDGSPSLCNSCEGAGCDASGEHECDADHAYGGVGSGDEVDE